MSGLLTILRVPDVKRLAMEAVTKYLAEVIEERNAAELSGDLSIHWFAYEAELLDALIVAIKGAA